VWSNMCKSVFIFGLYKLKLFRFKQCFQSPLIQIFFSFCRAVVQTRYFKYFKIELFIICRWSSNNVRNSWRFADVNW
jgi:hypothetical protein